MRRLLAVGVLILGGSVALSAQTILNETTLTNALTDVTTTTFILGSTSNVTAGTTGLFIPLTGEYMTVTTIPVSGTVTVSRGASGTRPMLAPAAARVVITQVGSVINYDPGGACTRGTGIARFSPVINLANGVMWICRTSLWRGALGRDLDENSPAAIFTN